MVGGFVEDQQLRRLARNERQIEPRLLPARKRGNRHIRLLPGETEPADPGADALGRGVGQQTRKVAERRGLRLQRVDLMLREIADREVAPPCHDAPLRREQVRQQPGEGGLAVAVRAEQRNPFVRVDPQVQASQHRTARLVTRRRHRRGSSAAGRARRARGTSSRPSAHRPRPAGRRAWRAP